MAESTLSLTFADMYQQVAQRFFNTLTPTGDILDAAKRYVNAGYRLWQLANAAQVLHASTTLVAFKSVTGTASGTPSTTLTATTSIFYPGMVGHSVTVGSGTYTISGYTSGTVVTLSSTAAGEGAAPSISLTATGNVRMPDDFGGLRGGINFATNSGYVPPRPNTPGGIDSLRTLSTGTGLPEYYTIRPAAFSSSVGQRFELMLWRIPDQNYTLYFDYLKQFAQMTSDSEYPVGGMAHGATILQCGMAEGEMDTAHVEGPEAQKRNSMMGMSAVHDAQTRPALLGRAHDPSVYWARRRDPNDWDAWRASRQ